MYHVMPTEISEKHVVRDVSLLGMYNVHVVDKGHSEWGRDSNVWSGVDTWVQQGDRMRSESLL